MSKIFDCFNYNGEEDLLEIRLNTLNDVVDHFVISESEVTWSNLIKPIFFLEQKDKFKKFLHKITLHNCGPLELPKQIKITPWNIEWYQRNSIWMVLNELAKPDDIIMYSGLDEIPKPELIKEHTQVDKTVFMMDPCYYYINCVSNKPKYHGTFSLKKSTLDDYYLKDSRYKSDQIADKQKVERPFQGLYWAMNDFGLEKTRVEKQDFKNVIEKAGWHYQFYGTTKEIAKKLMSYSHLELFKKGYATMDIINDFKKKMVAIGPGEEIIPLKKVGLNEESAPDYVLKNQDKFSILK